MILPKWESTNDSCFCTSSLSCSLMLSLLFFSFRKIKNEILGIKLYILKCTFQVKLTAISPFTQPTNHSTGSLSNQPITHTTNQSPTQPITNLTNHPLNQPITHSTNQSPTQPTNHPLNQPITHSTNQSPTQPTNHPLNQPNKQPPVGRSALRLLLFYCL